MEERRHPLERTEVAIESPLKRPRCPVAAVVHLRFGREVPLADHERRVTALSEGLREGRELSRQAHAHAGVPGVDVGHHTETRTVRIGAGEQSRARGRAQRCDVKVGQPVPAVGESIQSRGADLPAERADIAETEIVDEHDHDVRGSLAGTFRGGLPRRRHRGALADRTAETFIAARISAIHADEGAVVRAGRCAPRHDVDADVDSPYR